jgi:Putative Actinobacterial Holin-X, holin superfamily III
MHTQGAEAQHNGLGTAAKQVAEHASALVRLELELAQLEVQNKVGALGAGMGLLVGAAIFGLFAVGFLLATAAAALATAMATWLALLLVAVFLLVLTTVLVLVGKRLLEKGTPPVPQQAIDEAKLTTAALRRDGD